MRGVQINQCDQPQRATTRPSSKFSRFASHQEVMDRLAGDLDSLVVAVLDDLSYEIIKAYGNRLPNDCLEWIGTTATNNVRRLAKVIYAGEATRRMTQDEFRANSRPESIRFLAICWLRPQMERRFGPLPSLVGKVLTPKLTLRGCGA
jgi:hypothetical protein